MRKNKPIQEKKPPLGIMPKQVHDEIRRRDLGEAIVRYIEASLLVPPEWVEEYNELIEPYQADTPNSMRTYQNNEEHMKEAHMITLGGRNFNDCMRRAKAEGLIQ